MSEVIILGDPGMGRIYAHEEAASRVEGATAVALGSAGELEDKLLQGSKPSILVLDFGWTNVVPSVLYKTLGREAVKALPTLMIKTSNGSSAERQMEQYFNVAGYIPTGADSTRALPLIINAFLEHQQQRNGSYDRREFQGAIQDIVRDNAGADLDYLRAASRRDPRNASAGPANPTSP